MTKAVKKTTILAVSDKFEKGFGKICKHEDMDHTDKNLSIQFVQATEDRAPKTL